MSSLKSASKRIKMDSQEETGILNLPNELLEKIFLMLPRRDVQHNLALVCQRFLNVTRRSKFVENVRIELIPKEDDDWCEELDNSCLEKIEKVLKFYPRCKIDLFAKDTDWDEEGEEEIDGYGIYGYSWMKGLVPFAASIRKLDLPVEPSMSLRHFSDVISFENLEVLEIGLGINKQNRFHEVENFWSNFPNLKSLRFDTGIAPPNTIDEFINKVCSNCKNLERVCYGDSGHSLTVKQFSIVEAQSQAHHSVKFPNINYISIYKTDVGNVHDRELVIRKKAALEKLKNHLTAKFPNLQKPIQTTYRRSNIVHSYIWLRSI